MERITQITSSLLTVNFPNESDKAEQRRIRLVQFCNLVGVGSVVLYDLLYLVADWRRLYPVTLTTLATVLFFVLSISLNQRGRFELAKVSFSLGLLSSMLVATGVFLGKEPGIHFYFLLFALTPILIWNFRQIFAILLFMSLNLLSFFYVQFWQPSAWILIQPFPAAWDVFFRIMSIVAVYATIAGILIFYQYLGERYEQSLLAQTIELDRFFTTSLDLLCIADMDGIFHRLNREWENTLGYPVNQLIGRRFMDFVHPEDAPATLAAMARLERQEIILNFENRYRCQDGSYRWIEWRSTPVGKMIYAAARDVTERRQAEDKIKNLLHEKEVLLKEVHHRIKNNMNTVASLLNLQKEVQKDETVKKALRDAEASLQSMMILYDQLYRSETFAAVSLREYVPALLQQVIGIFPHGETVSLYTDLEDIPLAPRILSPLGILLNELATNAMKYAFTGRSDGVITVTAAREGEQVVLHFADNGKGLPASFSFAAGGFGMQLARSLARQLGGSIAVEEGPGARFVLRFARQ